MAGICVEHAVLRSGNERGGGVLSREDGEEGLDVECIESSGGGQGTGFVADVEGAVDQRDVCFDGGAADAEGGVEGDGAPVVVVGVDSFLDGGLGGREEGEGVEREQGKGRGSTGTMPCVRLVG